MGHTESEELGIHHRHEKLEALNFEAPRKISLLPLEGGAKIQPMKIHDISPLISEETAVFPGDQKFSRNVSLDFEKKDGLLLSSIQFSAHLGAHTDAPNHYNPKGIGIHQRDLEYYLGPCQVITVKLKNGDRIKPKDITGIEILAQRILFRTNSFPDPNKWNNDFVALSKELVGFLADKGVILVGIDTPSIDLADDKILESHNVIFNNDMAILEGIVLTEVKDGKYILSALPLKIKNCDASPVRAVLIEGPMEWESFETDSPPQHSRSIGMAPWKE